MSSVKVGVVCMGRGICRDSVGDWWPTPYFEIMTPDRNHTGVFVERADPNHPLCFIGGSEQNAMAGNYLAGEFVDYLAFLMITGGRPRYLADNPAVPEDLTEGSVMFDRVISRNSMLKLGENVIIPKHNKNSIDDVKSAYQYAEKDHVTRLVVTTVAVHLPRTALFFERMGRQYPAVETRFVASEDVLLLNNYWTPNEHRNMLVSLPFQRNAHFEMKGMRDFLTGVYASIKNQPPTKF